MDIRRIVLLVLFLFIGAVAHAQDPFQSVSSSGNGGSTAMRTPGGSSVSVSVTGTWSGTLTFQKSGDVGSTYASMACINESTNALTSTTTANGNFICSAGGAGQVRVLMSAYVSGTALVTFWGGSGAGPVSLARPLPTGANTIGAVTIASSAVGSAGVAEGTSFSSATTTTLVGVRRCDTPSPGTGVVNGDVAVPCVSDDGALEVQLVAPDGSIPNFGTAAAKSTAAPNDGTLLFAEADDTSTQVVAEGNAGSLRLDATSRRLLVQGSDCDSDAKLFKNISQTAGTQLVTGTASKKLYICSIQFVTATAQNIALIAGTGTVCATNSVGIMGGTTAATGWNLAINARIDSGNGGSSIAATTVNADNLCLVQSASGQISGSLTYIVK